MIRTYLKLFSPKELSKIQATNLFPSTDLIADAETDLYK